MSDKKMKFYLPDFGETMGDAREITGINQPTENHMADSFAEDAANYYNREGGGCDEKWPIKFAIIGIDGSPLGVFRVGIDYDPSFYAEKVK